LERQDGELGEKVITGDAEINDLYLELEGQCTDLIALQQPVAGDLRFIAASFKIITDLERIADLATNLGEYAKQADREVFPDVDVQRIGDDTLAMLDDAMAATPSRTLSAVSRSPRRTTTSTPPVRPRANSSCAT